MRIPIWIFTAAMLVAATNAQAAVRWHEDFGRAQQIAAQTGRPLLVHFWKAGCPPCRYMEQSVFPNPDVGRVIEAGYVPVKINANQSPNLARRFGVTHLPTDVIVSPTGEVLAKSNAPKSPAAYVAQLQRFSGPTEAGASRQVAYGDNTGTGNTTFGYGDNRSTQSDRWSASTNSDQTYSPRTTSSQIPTNRQQPYGTTPRLGGRYQVGTDVRNDGYARTGGQSYATQNQPSYSPGRQRPLADDSPAPYNANSQRGGFAPPAPSERFRRQPTPQVARPNITVPTSPRNRPSRIAPSWDQKGPAPAFGGGSPNVDVPQFSRPSGRYNISPPTDQPTDPRIDRGRPSYADQQQPRQYRQEPWRGGTLSNRRGGARSPQRDMSRFALEGHCPVTLFEQQNLHPSQRRWTLGDERWGARHEGRVYLFAGPEEQRKFLTNPNRYAPVLQGLDPVLAIDERRTVPGQRQHGVYYDGRIYLFANEGTLQRFETNTQRYDTRALQAVRPRRGGSQR